MGAGRPGLRASGSTLSPTPQAGNSLGDRGLRLTWGAPSCTQSKAGEVPTASEPHVPCPPPPVSDLAPGQSGMDDMKLLEQRAEQLAAEAERDQPSRAQSKILFVR